jgi:hypothetical protein
MTDCNCDQVLALKREVEGLRRKVAAHVPVGAGEALFHCITDLSDATDAASLEEAWQRTRLQSREWEFTDREFEMLERLRLAIANGWKAK